MVLRHRHAGVRPRPELGPVGVRRRTTRGSSTALPRVPIAGPDTQRAAVVCRLSQRFLSPHSRVRMLASHGYGLNNCVTNPASAAYPSIPHLLGDYALHDLLNTLIPYVGSAHANGATFRIDEMGSVTCNGRLGVSNTMASALWAAAALFSVAQDGVDGVNLHTYPGLSNGLFDFTDSARRVDRRRSPALLRRAAVLPRGARRLAPAARVAAAARRRCTGGRRRGPGAVRHVVLLNDSTHRQRRRGGARAARRPRRRPAQLERLTAPSVSATGDISARRAQLRRRHRHRAAAPAGQRSRSRPRRRLPRDGARGQRGRAFVLRTMTRLRRGDP